MRAWTDTRAPYVKYAATIRAKIMAGDWPDQLPSVKQLMAELGTSSTSVIQRALDILESEGFVERQHGKGNFARLNQLVVIDATPDPMATGLRYRVRKVEFVLPPADVRAQLGIPLPELAILREQVGSRDGDPVEFVSNYYRFDVAEGTPVGVDGPIKGGAKKLLKEKGFVEAEMIDLETVRPPTEEEVVALELPEGVPVLAVLRTILDERGVPIEVSTIVKGGHRYALRRRTALR